LQIREQLVVTLELELVQQVLVQLVLVQLVLVQLEQELQLFVAPLELVEHPCLQAKIGVQKMLTQPENLAYLF
jgi:hypothetical protein